MNITQKTSIAITLLGILITAHAFVRDASAQETGRRRQGPPPEAYTACEGKTVGDTAMFESPRGETVTGTCEQEGDRLVLRPDRGKGNAGGRSMNNPND
jgi:hypothetical protein